MSACTRSHIVVTGTSSGIGRATALRLAAAGHHVYAGVRRPTDAPPPTSADLGEITPLPLDVADPVQVTAAADTVAGHTGNAGLHRLVNNAGIGVFGPLELIPVELSSQRPTRRHGRHGRDRHAAPLPRPGEALVKYVARPRRRVSATRLLTRPGRTRAGPGMPRTSSETAA
jgi:NAD(P)-dependent dehydrogenase (short-subunit alcohol dehydrogenase family)